MIDAAIARAVALLEPSASLTGSVGAELVAAVSHASEGGKRMRAKLALESFAAHGGTDVEVMVPVVAALELFQTAALMHDDVLDDESMRRGRPTTHRQFAQAHADRRDATDAERFGVAGAILAGDLALVAAFRAIEPAPAPARDLLGRMMEMVTLGQYLDMRIAAAPIEAIAHQEAQIRATMRNKTASYTAEFPLALGAAAAGRDEDAIEAARAAGVPAGIAFQLRDDLLGIVGDPSATGKPVGGDIREGKRTIPLWHAWRLAHADQRAAIAAALGRPDAADETVASAISAIEGSGAIAATEAEIAAMAAQAHERVAGLAVPVASARALATMLTAWGVRQA